MKGWIMQANLTEGNSKENMRMFLYEASNTEEPCARKPHAGICEGAVGKLAVLPRCPSLIMKLIVAFCYFML
ncbi:hypothetical protein JT06_12760 [Desulfobulbus sp. Tol-SR]|nr:hypothetical protein JT06_12760 [Desulfobulbus sp. Tol-SR]